MSDRLLSEELRFWAREAWDEDLPPDAPMLERWADRAAALEAKCERLQRQRDGFLYDAVRSLIMCGYSPEEAVAAVREACALEGREP